MYFDSQFERGVHPRGRYRGRGHRHHSQVAERDGYGSSAHRLLFVQSGTPVQGMLPHIQGGSSCFNQHKNSLPDRPSFSHGDSNSCQG